jgi:hypothetical protein
VTLQRQQPHEVRALPRADERPDRSSLDVGVLESDDATSLVCTETRLRVRDLQSRPVEDKAVSARRLDLPPGVPSALVVDGEEAAAAFALEGELLAYLEREFDVAFLGARPRERVGVARWRRLFVFGIGCLARAEKGERQHRKNSSHTSSLRTVRPRASYDSVSGGGADGGLA